MSCPDGIIGITISNRVPGSPFCTCDLINQKPEKLHPLAFPLSHREDSSFPVHNAQLLFPLFCLTIMIFRTHLKTKGWARIPTGVINVKCSCKWRCFPAASSTCCLSWLPS